jgi:hypothetical protein
MSKKSNAAGIKLFVLKSCYRDIARKKKHGSVRNLAYRPIESNKISRKKLT